MLYQQPWPNSANAAENKMTKETRADSSRGATPNVQRSDDEDLDVRVALDACAAVLLTPDQAHWVVSELEMWQGNRTCCWTSSRAASAWRAATRPPPRSRA